MAISNTESRDRFIPKSYIALQHYNLQKFFSDLIAGLTVGLVALPLALAFAISSGVEPKAGIYCAVVAGFLISALGGSMVQIGGPTGAFVVVISAIVQKHGIDGLFTCTVMAGVFLILLGVTGLGSAVKYIPRPVIIGFTNGIAVVIASTQVKDFLGLTITKVPGDFLGRMSAVIHNINSLSLPAVALGSSMLAVIIIMMIFVKRIPGIIVATFIGTLLAWVLHLPVATIQTRFGGIPAGLPPFQIPTFRIGLVLPLMSSAITVTMLCAIESLLSAVVADRMFGDKHNPNVELFAQGVANIFSPIFGGIPATGAIARTATNIRSGAKSPVAGMLHAATLLVILLVATPLADQIPLSVLAAILFVVSYNMGEWKEIPQILKLSKADISVWLITFSLTVFANLTVAVEAGMILAALLYIRKVTATTTVSQVDPQYIQKGLEHSLQHVKLPPGVSVFRIHGPFLFGASDKLSVITDQLDTLDKVVLLRLRNMNAIDATGLQALEELADTLHQSGRQLVLCGALDQPAKLMEQAEFHRHIGDANILPSLQEASQRVHNLLLDPVPAFFDK